MSRRIFWTAAAVVAVLAMVLPRVLSAPPMLVWNASASVPIGLYRVSPVRTLHVGDIAVIAPPEPLADLLAARRSLPKGVLLIKPVAALAGQMVCRHRRHITIDGMTVGVALARDHQNRPLPTWHGCHQLGQGDLFAMNPAAPDSFDGRYFGVLPLSSAIGQASPLWLPKEH